MAGQVPLRAVSPVVEPNASKALERARGLWGKLSVALPNKTRFIAVPPLLQKVAPDCLCIVLIKGLAGRSHPKMERLTGWKE